MAYKYKPKTQTNKAVLIGIAITAFVIGLLLLLPGKDERPLEVRLQEYLMKKVPRNATVAVEGVDPAVLDKIERPIVWLANYTPSKEPIDLNVTIRGSHKLWVYLADGEDLELNLSKQDLNWYNGTDVLRIEVYNPDLKLVYNYSIEDDGIDVVEKQFDPKMLGKEQFHRVFVKNKGQGAYKILLISQAKGDDFYIHLKSTMQNKMVFQDKIYIYLYDNFWFNCLKYNCNLNFMTYHNSSLQNFNIICTKNNYTISLNQTNKIFNFTTKNDENNCKFSKIENHKSSEKQKTSLIFSSNKISFFIYQNSFFYPYSIVNKNSDYLVIFKENKIFQVKNIEKKY
ncbi:MAG: hypothetical protein N3D75_03800 [Candidatus Aenigmarchaeota archaeon]|nr:hypothetical protein [Candidatus Aenigmarchaeota archaeon]